MTERDMKIRATTSPQQVPWANSNESRQKGQNLGGKSVVDMEGKSLKDLNVVSLRGQGNSALPVGNRAANLNTKGHQNDGRARETTNSCRQSHHVDGHDLGATGSSNLGHDNGERVSGYANSRSQSRHMDERVPGAFGVPGLNEDSEGRRHESPGISAHCITARVVDSEEEHRVLREQLHQALREVRAHEGVAVAHSAAIDGSVEHGNAAADDVDGSVERGKVTVGQAPVINKNLTVQQAPTINMDSSKSGGSWPAENQEEQVPILPHLNSQECTSNNTKANLSKEIASEKPNSKVRTVMSNGRIGVSHVKDAVSAGKSHSEAKEVCREHKPSVNPQYKDHVNDVEASPSVIDGTSLINADNFIQSNDPQSKLPNHDDANNSDDEDNAPKDTFGAMEGCFRDCHVKHGILYLGNITYLIAWLVSLDSPYFFGSWAALIVWMMLYGLFMIEFFCSSTAKYLRNINVTEDIIDFMQRLYKTPPTLTLRIECYHHEWRTVSYTDSEGRLQTRTEMYTVTTYIGREDINIRAWQDESHVLQEEDVRAYQLTKVKVHKTFTGDDNFERHCNDFVRRNRYRDVFYSFSIIYLIDGFKSRVLAYVDLEKRPAFLNFCWCLMAHLTLFPALPYRIWMSSICGKTDTTLHKNIQADY